MLPLPALVELTLLLGRSICRMQSGAAPDKVQSRPRFESQFCHSNLSQSPLRVSSQKTLGESLCRIMAL
jgi:hypothetical protein